MWQKLNVFKAVVETGNFAKAARQCGISTPSTTRYIQELEAEYKSCFFLRTTRHVSLTASGERFYQFVCDTLEAQQDLLGLLESQKETVSGNLKIGVPTSLIYNCFREIPQYLLDQYPNLSLEIIQGNHALNVLNNYFDLALHCGELPDLNLYATQVGTWQKMICASPGYLKKHGNPTRLTQLKNHNCLDHSANRSGGWQLLQDKQTITIPVQGNLKADSSMALAQFAEDGLGLVYLPHFTISRALHHGKLLPILKSNWPSSLPIYAVYPQRKNLNKKLAVLIDALRLFFQTK